MNVSNIFSRNISRSIVKNVLVHIRIFPLESFWSNVKKTYKYKMPQRHNGTNSRFVGKKWNWKTSLSSFNALQAVSWLFVVRAFKAYVYTDVSSNEKLSQEAWIPRGETLGKTGARFDPTWWSSVDEANTGADPRNAVDFFREILC